MIFVIIICETVGRRNDRSGGRLAALAVIISVLPVVFSLGLLVLHRLIMPEGSGVLG